MSRRTCRPVSSTRQTTSVITPEVPMRTLTRLSVAALVGAGVLIPMTGASAADAVTRSGACSGTTTWTLRAAEAAGDQAALRLTIDSTRAGQSWSVALSRQGTQFFSTRKTTDAHGNLTVSRSAPERKNVDDVYTGRATNLRTGETCSARVVLPD
jgi:hypothetical protein